MGITETSKEQLAALWEPAVPLDSAWIDFAKFFDRFSYRALRTHPANDDDVLAKDPRYNELQSWLPRTWEARKEKLLVTTRNERYHLLGELYAGRLWAIGFRMLPNGSDELVRVPRGHFFFVEGVGAGFHIDWGGAEVTDGAVRYFDIRIVKPPVVVTEESAEAKSEDRGERTEEPQTDDIGSAEDAPARQPKPEPGNDPPPFDQPVQATAHVKPRRTGGRPRTDDEIRSKVRELWSDPAFHAIKNRLEQAGEVRARLKGPQARGVHDMQSYGSAKIKRIIGEVATEQRRSAQN
jgi:hypothetical protein